MTATKTLPLSAQAVHHLTEMAQFQTDRDWDLTWAAWGLLRDLDYSPPDGDRFAGLWAEYVRVINGLRETLPGGVFFNWHKQARELLTALAGEPT